MKFGMDITAPEAISTVYFITNMTAFKISEEKP
jgi:hypothetical protein